jgi:quercetin dioxygenase-like cupin family protein
MDADITFHGGDDESGAVFMVQTKAPAGTILGQHRHDHSHLSYLVSGTAIVDVDDCSTEYVGPCPLTIGAGKEHLVVAVTDIVWLCLWSAELGMQEKAGDMLKILEAQSCGA